MPFIQACMNLIKTVTLFDLIDVLLVAFIIFQAIHMVKETRAEQLIKGLVGILLLFTLADLAEFKVLKYVLQMVLDNAVLAVLIVFQPEIRRVLEQVGRSKLSATFGGVLSGSSSDEAVGRIRLIRLIDALCDGCAYLSKQKMGALIVIERSTKLGEIIKTGTVIDADPTMEMIGSIFFKNSPLHDGAMVVRNGKLYAAGCFLPLSEQDINKALGTRHRAALGLSENSDALVIIVSEETGVISVAHTGTLERNYTLEKLNERLRAELLDDHAEEPEKKSGIWKVRK